LNAFIANGTPEQWDIKTFQQPLGILNLSAFALVGYEKPTDFDIPAVSISWIAKLNPFKTWHFGHCIAIWSAKTFPHRHL